MPGHLETRQTSQEHLGDISNELRMGTFLTRLDSLSTSLTSSSVSRTLLLRTTCIEQYKIAHPCFRASADVRFFMGFRVDRHYWSALQRSARQRCCGQSEMAAKCGPADRIWPLPRSGQKPRLLTVSGRTKMFWRR